jgi:hypothetical protein
VHCSAQTAALPAQAHADGQAVREHEGQPTAGAVAELPSATSPQTHSQRAAAAVVEGVCGGGREANSSKRTCVEMTMPLMRTWYLWSVAWMPTEAPPARETRPSWSAACGTIHVGSAAPNAQVRWACRLWGATA